MQKMTQSEDLLKIAVAFTKTPGPRYRSEGEFSGEQFRAEILLPRILNAIKKGLKLIVDLDGTHGYGLSFLEESFGGLIRDDGIRLETINSLLQIISDEEPDLKDEVILFMDTAELERIKLDDNEKPTD